MNNMWNIAHGLKTPIPFQRTLSTDWKQRNTHAHIYIHSVPRNAALITVCACARLHKQQQPLADGHTRADFNASQAIFWCSSLIFSKFLHVKNWPNQWNMQKNYCLDFLTMKATILDTHGRSGKSGKTDLLLFIEISCISTLFPYTLLPHTHVNITG